MFRLIVSTAGQTIKVKTSGFRRVSRFEGAAATFSLSVDFTYWDSITSH
jgi:hypothetical protein